jgi:hypothetical protein
MKTHTNRWSVGVSLTVLLPLGTTACTPSLVELEAREPSEVWIATTTPVASIDCVRASLRRQSGYFNHAARVTPEVENEGRHWSRAEATARPPSSSAPGHSTAAGRSSSFGTTSCLGVDARDATV